MGTYLFLTNIRVKINLLFLVSANENLEICRLDKILPILAIKCYYINIQLNKIV